VYTVWRVKKIVNRPKLQLPARDRRHRAKQDPSDVESTGEFTRLTAEQYSQQQRGDNRATHRKNSGEIRFVETASTVFKYRRRRRLFVCFASRQ
jgi:hypothetical protein